MVCWNVLWVCVMILKYIHTVLTLFLLRGKAYFPIPWVWARLGNSLLVKRIKQKSWCAILETRSERSRDFLLTLSLWSEGSQLPCHEKRSPWWASECAILEVDCQTFRWSQFLLTSLLWPYDKSWARTTQLRCSWIPDSKNLRHTKYSLF